jgi:hypothetical protein
MQAVLGPKEVPTAAAIGYWLRGKLDTRVGSMRFAKTAAAKRKRGAPAFWWVETPKILD